MTEIPIPQQEDIYSYGFDKSLNRNATESQTPEVNMTEKVRDALLQAGIDVNTVDGVSYSNRIYRNDFHWLTIFESLDGYTQTILGGGAITIPLGVLTFTTGATSGNNCILEKWMLYGAISAGWNKNTKIKTAVKFGQTGDSKTIRLGMGDMNANANRKIGFLVSNSTLYGIVGDGTGYTLKEYGIIDTTTVYLLEVNFLSRTSCEFFVNGSSIGISTTNLPAGNPAANIPFACLLQTNENVAKTLEIGYYDFWQAN